MTGCSGTPTDTEVVRVRLLGACCGVEFLVISVAIVNLGNIDLWCNVMRHRHVQMFICVVRVFEVEVVGVVVVVEIVTEKEK